MKQFLLPPGYRGDGPIDLTGLTLVATWSAAIEPDPIGYTEVMLPPATAPGA